MQQRKRVELKRRRVARNQREGATVDCTALRKAQTRRLNNLIMITSRSLTPAQRVNQDAIGKRPELDNTLTCAGRSDDLLYTMLNIFRPPRFVKVSAKSRSKFLDLAESLNDLILFILNFMLCVSTAARPDWTAAIV